MFMKNSGSTSKEMLKRQRDLLITISKLNQEMVREDIEKIAAKIYLDAGKTMNALTRDLNDLVQENWLVLENEKYRPATERILERLPFSFQ